jgi:hypothetical protein
LDDKGEGSKKGMHPLDEDDEEEEENNETFLRMQRKDSDEEDDGRMKVMAYNRSKVVMNQVF